MMMIGETMTDGTVAAGTGIGAGMITMTDAAIGMIMTIGTGAVLQGVAAAHDHGRPPEIVGDERAVDLTWGRQQ
jgi:hypothetical protein